MIDSVSMRLAYGEALVDLGKSRPDIVVLSADVSNSDHSFMFEESFPDRFYNVGIAEQALVDVAVGLAHSGKVPFVNTFAFLFATRALEMVRSHLCYGMANVKLMGAYAGLSDSFDGPTHHSITDIAIMRSLPNMTVIVPSDPVAVKKLLPQIAAMDGPVFTRLNRNSVPVLFDESYAPKIGRGIVVRDGDDATIVCNGMAVSRSLLAADLLREKGVNVRVIELHTVKPIDSDLLVKAAKDTGFIVTVEEHSIIGGLGSAVTEVMAESCPVPVKRLGIADQFAETGPYTELLDRYGLAVEGIVEAVIDHR